MSRFTQRMLVAAVAWSLAGAAAAQSYVTAGAAPLRGGHGEYWQSTSYVTPEEVAHSPEISYSAQVRFPFDDDTLTGEARKRLDALAEKLVALEIDKVVAVGYSDGVGSPQYNKRLSARRAKAVGDYLAGKGVAAERLQLVALGERDPVTAGACEFAATADRSDPRLITCLEPDRRVEIELTGRRKN
jgi:outer membrane protein OmpA-like peptidoglycan-associated protein